MAKAKDPAKECMDYINNQVSKQVVKMIEKYIDSEEKGLYEKIIILFIEHNLIGQLIITKTVGSFLKIPERIAKATDYKSFFNAVWESIKTSMQEASSRYFLNIISFEDENRALRIWNDYIRTDGKDIVKLVNEAILVKNLSGNPLHRKLKSIYNKDMKLFNFYASVRSNILLLRGILKNTGGDIKAIYNAYSNLVEAYKNQQKEVKKLEMKAQKSGSEEDKKKLKEAKEELDNLNYRVQSYRDIMNNIFVLFIKYSVEEILRNYRREIMYGEVHNITLTIDKNLEVIRIIDTYFHKDFIHTLKTEFEKGSVKEVSSEVNVMSGVRQEKKEFIEHRSYVRKIRKAKK